MDAAIGIGLGAYGDKPTVPVYKSVNAGDEAANAISANTKNLGSAEYLTSQANSFNQDQMLAMLRKAIPGYDSIVSKATGNISSELSGQLPQGVSDMVQNSSAAQALAGGFAGSRFGGNLTAKDLGLTSLDLTQKGLDSASRWIQASKSPQMDVSSMFISPAQQIAVTTNNNNMDFQRNWLQNQITAMPDPSMKALAGGASQDLGMASSALGSYMGGSSGGSGGGSL